MFLAFFLFKNLIGINFVRSLQREQSPVSQRVDGSLKSRACLVELVEKAVCTVAFVELQMMVVVELGAVQEWQVVARMVA